MDNSKKKQLLQICEGRVETSPSKLAKYARSKFHKEGIDPAMIYGYNREEFTHTSVAAQIASNTADAGMGILSASKLYDLDFVPICMEQYDLLIPDSAFDTPMVQCLLEVLQSPAFAARLEALGGYELNHPGKVRACF